MRKCNNLSPGLTITRGAAFEFLLQWFEYKNQEYRYRGGYWEARTAGRFPQVDFF